MLDVMARDVGAVQIQTRGTLAGNIATASPAADGVPALMALEGVVTLVKEGGTRTVPRDQFFLAYRKTALLPGELIAAIDVRVPKPAARVVWRKVGTRLAQAISKVALAGVAEATNGRLTRLGLGMASVAPTTALLPTVRALMLSKPPAALKASELDAATDADTAPIDDVRSTAAYRRHVARALVRNFAAELART